MSRSASPSPQQPFVPPRLLDSKTQCPTISQIITTTSFDPLSLSLEKLQSLRSELEAITADAEERIRKLQEIRAAFASRNLYLEDSAESSSSAIEIDIGGEGLDTKLGKTGNRSRQGTPTQSFPKAKRKAEDYPLETSKRRHLDQEEESLLPSESQPVNPAVPSSADTSQPTSPSVIAVQPVVDVTTESSAAAPASPAPPSSTSSAPASTTTASSATSTSSTAPSDHHSSDSNHGRGGGKGLPQNAAAAAAAAGQEKKHRRGAKTIGGSSSRNVAPAPAVASDAGTEGDEILLQSPNASQTSATPTSGRPPGRPPQTPASASAAAAAAAAAAAPSGPVGTQVSAEVFQKFTEPFLRPLVETDLTLLESVEEEDPLPFIIPPLGRHYADVWTEEMGEPWPKPPLPLQGESDAVNLPLYGALTERLLASLIEEGLVIDQETNQQLRSDDDENEMVTDVTLASSGPTPATTPAATPTSSLSLMNAETLENRIRRELLFVGLLEETDPGVELTSYQAQQNALQHHREDDEICMQLRTLQQMLRKQAALNNARKARLYTRVKAHLGYQEYQAVLAEIHRQIEQAYVKRLRTGKKGRRKDRPKPMSDDLRRSMDRAERLPKLLAAIFPEEAFAIPTHSIYEGWEAGPNVDISKALSLSNAPAGGAASSNALSLDMSVLPTPSSEPSTPTPSFGSPPPSSSTSIAGQAVSKLKKAASVGSANGKLHRF